MRDHPRDRWDDDEPRPRRRRLPARPTRKRSNLLLILLAVGGGLVVLGCGGAVVGYFAFGVKTTSDPAQVEAGLDGITDMQIPAALGPHSWTVQITGVNTAEFRSGSGRSYVIVTTGPRLRLGHSGTLREARDRGASVGGGNPESPTQERIVRATIRGRPAEFKYRRYSGTETISGYFQGKQYPAHIEAELSLAEFPPDMAVKTVESIQ